MSSFGCHICGCNELTRIAAYERLHRVTSDCKPWPPGGRLVVCNRCGCAQAIVDAAWEAETKSIYGEYTIYHQAKGVEQNVFDQASGHAVARSDRLLQRFEREVTLPRRGRLLDIGCGNGALLRAFSRRWPEWRSAGVEVGDQYRAQVEAIPGVEGLFTPPPEQVPGKFNLITLVHVLEHIASPIAYLTGLADKLEPDGKLLVHVPDCESNPFMFVVADHASHFFSAQIQAVVKQGGYRVVAAGNDWVAKELSVAAEPERGGAIRNEWPARAESLRAVETRIAWLQQIVEQSRGLRSRGAFGVFGTSIAATWLYAELDSGIDFFVDEDPNRIGQRHLGVPVLAPDRVPGGSRVLIALPRFLAESVAARLAASRAEFHLPDPLL